MSQVALAWNAATDNVKVTGYRVFRNGVRIADVTNTSYKDTAVTTGATYTYTVAALDAAGNVSTPSAGLTVTIP
jgi:chitinase